MSVLLRPVFDTGESESIHGEGDGSCRTRGVRN